MPLDRLAAEPLYNFLGVNLRRDELSLEDGEMARAINVDLHTMVGAVLLRRGRRPLDRLQLPAPVRQIGRFNARLYRVAGTALYNNLLPLDLTLSADSPVAWASYRPLNDTRAWLFVAQGDLAYKQQSDDLFLWGIVPPAAVTSAVGAAGTLTGIYSARYTYVREVEDKVAHESNPSPISVERTLASQNLSVSVTASTDPQVTHIRLYRTVAGGTLHLFDQQVDNVTAVIASSKVDTALGAQVELDNDVPPLLGHVAEYQSHFFGVGDTEHPDYLWYAKRWRPESWPAEQFLRIGTEDDPLLTLVRQAGFLGVFSRRTKYRVSGNAISGFAWAETQNTRGTIAPQAVCSTSAGVVFWAHDGIFLTNFLQADQEISQALAPLFERGANGYNAIQRNQAHQFSLAEYKRRLYAGYIDSAGERLIAVYSRDTNQWYHYRHPCHTLYYDEADDLLLMGTSAGEVAVLEAGAVDLGVTTEPRIAVDAATRTMTGTDRFTRKIFKFLKLDVEAVGDGGTVTLYIDGAIHQVIPVVSTDRTTLRSPLRLQDIHGYGWSLAIVGAVQLYGATMFFSPLETM